jgi:hypothetical protein
MPKYQHLMRTRGYMRPAKHIFKILPASLGRSKHSNAAVCKLGSARTAGQYPKAQHSSSSHLCLLLPALRNLQLVGASSYQLLSVLQAAQQQTPNTQIVALLLE